MLTLQFQRGRTNVIHQARVQKLAKAGGDNSEWTETRFAIFIAQLGAHRIPNVEPRTYVDWWGWRYKLVERN